MRQPRPRRVTVIRYYVDGQQVPKGTAGAERKKERSDTYYAHLVLSGKRQRISLKTTDLQEAWVRLRAHLRLQAERQAGIRDDFTDQGGRSLEEHLAEWGKAVRAKGTGQDHVACMEGRLKRLFARAGWRRLGDITLDSCLTALAELRTEDGFSAQTRNHYASHARQFCRWCCRARPRRLRENPLEGIEMVSVEDDRRHDRRSPTDEELRKLFAYLATAPERSGMTGRQRSLGYQVAMVTGCRFNEVKSLTRESFDLAAETGTVTVQAGYSKRRRRDTQYLPPWLTAELRDWFAAGGQTWGRMPGEHTARLLRADLKGAGVPYVVQGAGGESLYFDFHALRHWYCTQVANQPGISPKTMMELTRHSTADLAMRVYAKAKREDVRAAVCRLPRPGGASCSREQGSGTGKDASAAV